MSASHASKFEGSDVPEIAGKLLKLAEEWKISKNTGGRGSEWVDLVYQPGKDGATETTRIHLCLVPKEGEVTLDDYYDVIGTLKGMAAEKIPVGSAQVGSFLKLMHGKILQQMAGKDYLAEKHPEYPEHEKALLDTMNEAREIGLFLDHNTLGEGRGKVPNRGDS